MTNTTTLSGTGAITAAQDGARQKAEDKAKKSWFGRMLDSRRESKAAAEAVKAVCEGENGATGSLASLYATLDEKGKAKALKELSSRFVYATNELTLCGESADAATGMAQALELLAKEGGLRAENGTTDPSLLRVLGRMNDILEDQTEGCLYSKHPDLVIACAKAKWALTGDIEMLSDTLRDPSLRDWAVDVALERGMKRVLVEAASNKALVGTLLQSEVGRDAVCEAIRLSDNGAREEIVDSVVASKSEHTMATASLLARNAMTAYPALQIAARSGSFTEEGRNMLVSGILQSADTTEKGGLFAGALEEALYDKSASGMVAGVLLSSEKGRNIITIAACTDVKGGLLGALASLGEQKIAPLLCEWSNNRETRGFLVRTAAMLDATSVALQKAVLSYATDASASRRERKAARKAYATMMGKEAERKAAALCGTLNVLFSGMGEEIQGDPKQEKMGAQVIGTVNGMNASVQIQAEFSAPEGAEAEPAELAKTKIDALKEALNNLMGSMAEFLPIKPQVAEVVVKTGAAVEALVLHAVAKMEFGNEW